MLIPRSVVELPLRLEPVTPDPFAEPASPAPRAWSFPLMSREGTEPEVQQSSAGSQSLR
jgi:hypothetical protein